jgi:predicted flavoprotein YhiN
MNVCPEHTAESLDAWLLAQRHSRPRALVVTVLTGLLPAAVALAWSRASGLPDGMTMSHLTREQRRAVVQMLHARDLLVRDSRGYNYAEVTAGGIPLDEVDVTSMESRVCPGFHLVGEVLDVDGRLGGFNFQWAWSSAWVAGQALGHRHAAQ